jgi:hypothetical protein
VARWMQRRHEECTTAISTKAKKESEGPSYFHLFKNTNSHITILTQKQNLNCDEIVVEDSQDTFYVS